MLQCKRALFSKRIVHLYYPAPARYDASICDAIWRDMTPRSSVNRESCSSFCGVWEWWIKWWSLKQKKSKLKRKKPHSCKSCQMILSLWKIFFERNKKDSEIKLELWVLSLWNYSISSLALHATFCNANLANISSKKSLSLYNRPFWLYICPLF